MAAKRCCSCNGTNAVCKRCSCVKAGKPCFSCQPSRCGKCVNNNSNPLFQSSRYIGCPPQADPTDSVLDDGTVIVDDSCTSCESTVDIHTGLLDVSTRDSQSSLQSESEFADGHYLEPNEVDELILKAYGAVLVRANVGNHVSEWAKRWNSIVHLTGSHYDIPRGPIGRHYIDILCVELQHLIYGNYPSERLITFSSVILQRDKMIKKVSDVKRLLDRRLSMWSEDKFDLLVQEAKRCDRSLYKATRVSHKEDHVIKIFTRLMLQGKIKSAMSWLADKFKGTVLKPTDRVTVKSDNHELKSVTVIDALKMKHPDPKPPHSSTLLVTEELPQFEDLQITGAHINVIAHRIKGSAGPGGCHSSHWQDALLRFGSLSQKLRDIVANLSSMIANSLCDWSLIRALFANRLIALDKCPGIRPIGIGESLRRIISKTICLLTRDDVEFACGSHQLCAGLQCGIEGAVHAACDLFESNDWGMLMVDASNAFNSINRITLLWNVRILWPRASRFLFNTYQGWSPLLIKNSPELLFSKEGVIQGDPISMFMYAIGSLSLIQRLNAANDRIQIWYADDASVIGELSQIRCWFDDLIKIGPLYGYYPEPAKCHLVVKEPFISIAKELFVDLGINISTSGRLLGGVVGDISGKESFVTDKVKEWSGLIHKLSSIAATQPQAAFAALTKSLQNEWTYLQRVVPDCDSLFESIELILSDEFLPALFGNSQTSKSERLLYSLPIRMGGLNIRNPTITATNSYQSSRKATFILIEAIKGNISFCPIEHHDSVSQSRLEHRSNKLLYDNNTFDIVLNQLDHKLQRSILRAKDSLSSWLNVIPTKKDFYDLSANEFRDALSLRYSKPLLLLPPNCDGCGDLFTTTHALDCRKGGLVIQRHNEIRDTIYDLCTLAWSQVTKEPVIQDSLLDPTCVGLVADIGVRGVWQPQTTTLFDIRVIDTDAPSYINHSPSIIISNAERDKKVKYSRACESRHASFSPLCISIDGLLGKEFSCFLKRLADRLSSKWDLNYSIVMNWLRSKLSFAVLRATNLCIRGSRTKWRGLGLEDGAGINPLNTYT